LQSRHVTLWYFCIINNNNLHYHYTFTDYDFISAPIDPNYFKAAVQSRGGDIPLPEKKFYHDHPLDKFIYSSKLYTDDVVSVAALGIGAGLSLRSARSMQVSSTDFYNYFHLIIICRTSLKNMAMTQMIPNPNPFSFYVISKL